MSDIENDGEVEERGIIEACLYADAHWEALQVATPGCPVQLTGDLANDWGIYKSFRSNFDFDVTVVSDEIIKNPAAKKQWQNYLVAREGLVEGFNIISLLRIDSRLPYLDENTILVPRAQFLAIEAARNREGANYHVMKGRESPLLPEDDACARLSELGEQVIEAAEQGASQSLAVLDAIRHVCDVANRCSDRESEVRSLLARSGIGRTLSKLKSELSVSPDADVSVYCALRNAIKYLKSLASGEIRTQLVGDAERRLGEKFIDMAKSVAGDGGDEEAPGSGTSAHATAAVEIDPLDRWYVPCVPSQGQAAGTASVLEALLKADHGAAGQIRDGCTLFVSLCSSLPLVRTKVEFIDSDLLPVLPPEASIRKQATSAGKVTYAVHLGASDPLPAALMILLRVVVCTPAEVYWCLGTAGRARGRTRLHNSLPLSASNEQHVLDTVISTLAKLKDQGLHPILAGTLAAAKSLRATLYKRCLATGLHRGCTCHFGNFADPSTIELAPIEAIGLAAAVPEDASDVDVEVFRLLYEMELSFLENAGAFAGEEQTGGSKGLNATCGDCYGGVQAPGPVSIGEQCDKTMEVMFNEMYQTKLMQATTAIGTKQQYAESDDPAKHQSEETHGIVTKAVIEAFSKNGIAVIDNAWDEEKIDNLREEIESMVDGGHLQPTFQADVGTRYDVMRWLTEESVSPDNRDRPMLQRAMRMLKGVAHELKSRTGLRLRVPKHCMVACYDGGGTHYVAHRDNKCKVGSQPGLESGDSCHNMRAVTCLLYTSKGWTSGHGGCLRCHFEANSSDDSGCDEGCERGAIIDHPETRKLSVACIKQCCHVDVAPVAGRMVLFRSQELLHEVLPSHIRRSALSLWILAE